MDLIKKQEYLTKNKAKALYFATDYSPQKIAMLAEAPENEVIEWIIGTGDLPKERNPDSWFYKKEIEGVKLVGREMYREIEPMLITASKATALNVLTGQLEKMLERSYDEDMNVDDVKKIMDIFTSIDKIDRLEQGRATSITETKLDRMDAAEIVAERRRRSDYINAEYTEL